MSTALAVVPPNTLAATAVTDEQLELVKRTVAQGATDAELKLYLHDCQRRGVHPLDRLVHFTKRGGKYTPITSIDFMRSRAHDTGECAGIGDAEFSGPPMQAGFAARVTVKRIVQGIVCDFTATARWDEYCPATGQDHMWRKMPHVMLGKCAEALALRKAFPQQLAGLYAAEEMDQAEAPRKPPVVRTLKDMALTEAIEAAGEPEAPGTDIVDTRNGEVVAELPADVFYVREAKVLQTGTSKKSGKSYTLYGVTVHTGETFSTFDEPTYQSAGLAMETRQPVEIRVEEKRFGKEIVSFSTEWQRDTPVEAPRQQPVSDADLAVPFETR